MSFWILCLFTKGHKKVWSFDLYLFQIHLVPLSMYKKLLNRYHSVSYIIFRALCFDSCTWILEGRSHLKREKKKTLMIYFWNHHNCILLFFSLDPMASKYQLLNTKSQLNFFVLVQLWKEIIQPGLFSKWESNKNDSADTLCIVVGF